MADESVIVVIGVALVTLLGLAGGILVVFRIRVFRIRVFRVDVHRDPLLLRL